ncbi:hypothetical protein OGAPHI_005636 [Ogataea philodendri]|uniref:Eukaryotic translation initiation factor 5B n=1 Tax=Ogataea philodendri TaxID=1378263 RepID=A0A9P8P0F1_9ASCO|nr:uncharacterized protein OGAPHI_005636 [Ogataea philodendri]KAH3662384.1 hypothetical protein OGAPHI_005636 [Ogataea philodendri]
MASSTPKNSPKPDNKPIATKPATAPKKKTEQQIPRQQKQEPRKKQDKKPAARTSQPTQPQKASVKVKAKPKQKQDAATNRPKLDVPSFLTVANFAQILRVRVPELLQKMAGLGFEDMTNDFILDFETASLIADEYGFEVNTNDDLGADLFPAPEPKDEKLLKPRAPIVTIMGHVDHGKTTILDYLRKSSIVDGEHGGITQHIGAFVVKTPVSKKTITFLDTPGHAAFLNMRERGANITDVVVLVVAAEDSVMPQTKEALRHARNAGVPMVVAINKCDKPDANPDKVVADLSGHGVEVEDYGGEVPTVRVSGKTGLGMADLEETIVTVADLLDLKTQEDKTPVEGWVLESEVKKGLGIVATFLVMKGKLKPGAIIVAGQTWCKVRVMKDEFGKPLKVAGPATPVEISGWKDIPDAGEMGLEAPTEALAKKVITNREKRKLLLEEASQIEEMNKRMKERIEASRREEKIREYQQEGLTIDDIKELEPELFDLEAEKQIVVPYVIKADVSGSAEAIAQSITGLGNDEVQSSILYEEVGAPTESDIERAKIAGAQILAFNVKVPKNIINSASLAGVEIREFKVIYHLIEDVLETLTSKLPKKFETKVLSTTSVKQLFEITLKNKNKMTIAGCRVTNGVLKRSSVVRVMRKGDEIFRGKIKQLKHEKDDVAEVRNGMECGLSLDGDISYEVGDVIESIEEVEIKRHL